MFEKLEKLVSINGVSGNEKNVAEYIKNQQEHHRIKTFADEYLGLLNAYGIEYDERYIFND